MSQTHGGIHAKKGRVLTKVDDSLPQADVVRSELTNIDFVRSRVRSHLRANAVQTRKQPPLSIRLAMSKRPECSFDGLAGLFDCEPLAVNN